MQSVGTRLREARQKKGFSLDEINARTRINSRNLIAIEHDEVSNISSPFFYRSFVRQYAQEVDLDFQVLSSGVEFLAGHMRQPDLPGQGEHQPVRVAPIQARPKRDYSWVIPAALFLTVVTLGSAGYGIWKYYQISPSPQNSAVSSLVHKEAASKPPVPPDADKASRIKVTIVDVPLTPPPIAKQVVSVKQDASTVPNTALAEVTPVADKIHLELAAIEPTWLSISADGKPAYTGILEAAQVKVLEGQDRAMLKTGNAGGVTITFNGKSIGTIGPRGKTRTVVFTRTGYEVQPAGGATLMLANHIGG